MIVPADSRFGAGLTARRRGVRLFLAVVLTSVAALTLTACDAGSKPAARPSADATYGTLPGFLPSSTVQPDSVLVATADQPALTSQGDSVTVHVGGASVLVTVAGPEVPGEGLPYQAPATTCTWTVTLTAATAPVAITVSDFTTLDHLGTVYRPTLVAGQSPPPAVIRVGQTVTFEVRAVMRVGEGLMRWAPGGKKVVSSWDFEVEND